MRKYALLAAVASSANVFERISRRARVDWKDLIDKVRKVYFNERNKHF